MAKLVQKKEQQERRERSAYFPGSFSARSRESVVLKRSNGVLPRSGFPPKIEKLLCRVFLPVSQSF